MISVLIGFISLFSLGMAPLTDSEVVNARQGGISVLTTPLLPTSWSKLTVLAQADTSAAESPVEAKAESTDAAPAGNSAAPAGNSAAPAGNAAGANAKAPEDMSLVERIFASGIILPIGLVVLFYAIFLAPERRRKAEETKLMSGLKKNDRVVTIGGIHGTVASTSSDSDIVTLKIDESSGTRIRVNRSAIARIVTEPTSASDKDSATDSSAT